MKTKFGEFLNEEKDNWYEIEPKLELLKSYINIINNDTNGDAQLAINYFTVLHNFLIIERMFYNDVVASKKEINKYLILNRCNSIEDVNNLFNELYDVNSKVRNNVETFDNIESIRIYLSTRPEIFKKLMKK